MKKTEKQEAKKELRLKIQGILGGIIAELRHSADMTQEDLAYESGIDRSFMSKLERGETSISLITLVRLAETLGKKPSEILSLLEDKLVE